MRYIQVFLNKDSFSKKVRRYNKTEPKRIYKRAQKNSAN